MVELLVVIAIMGILASMLLPAVHKSREKGNQSECVNNIRQLGMALLLYASDHNSVFPLYSDAGVYWYDDPLDSYLDDRSVLECPSFKKYDPDDFRTQAYGINCHIASLPNGFMCNERAKLNRIKAPSKCMLIADSGAMPGSNIDGYYIIYNVSWFGFTFDYLPGDRHNGGANIFFCDGHVKWHRPEDIPTSGDESSLWWNN